MFFFGRPRDEGSRGVPVLLNVYDLLPQNDYMYPVGVGVFHSGLEVYGTEYSYGGHPYEMTGVFEVSPRQAAAFRFRYIVPQETVVLGYTFKSRAEVQTTIRELSREWLGNTYNTVFRNCNHFSDALCTRLLGYGIPGWVNRLAYLGQVFQCVLPHLGLEPPTAENAQLVRTGNASARGSVSAPTTPASERHASSSSSNERRPLLQSNTSAANANSEFSREERAAIAERRRTNVSAGGSTNTSSSTSTNASNGAANLTPIAKIVSVE